MPKFRYAISGLALATALAGGVVTMTTITATAANATTMSSSHRGHGYGWGGRGCRRGCGFRVDHNRVSKRVKFHKVNKRNAIVAVGDAVVDIDDDD
jgi:hypothetical protein